MKAINITQIINNKIREYEKKKVMLFLDEDDDTYIQLSYLTEALWDEVHEAIDNELTKPLSLTQRAEIHYNIETHLYTHGWPVMIEFMGQWFYEKYGFEFPEERYTSFLDQIGEMEYQTESPKIRELIEQIRLNK